MIEIFSKRLKLIPLDYELLVIWKNHGRSSLEKILKLNPNFWDLDTFYQNETIHALENFWIPHTKTNPLQFCWFTNWEIIELDANKSIGGIGFNGPPNNHGINEIGYLIEKKFQGKGYATEACNRLIEWAKQDKNLKSIQAKTFIDNLESQKVLEKNQFLRTQITEIDPHLNQMILTWILPISV